MVKLDIYGGLLGAGKTTLIRQMLASAYAGHKTAVIENEIGKVNLDAELLKDSSICVREITSGCICCTVKGNFTEAIRRLAEQEHPEYIIVEPSGVASLTDVVSACTDSGMAVLNRIIMVADARKQRKLLKVIGKFYLKQFLQRADSLSEFCGPDIPGRTGRSEISAVEDQSGTPYGRRPSGRSRSGHFPGRPGAGYAPQKKRPGKIIRDCPHALRRRTDFLCLEL